MGASLPLLARGLTTTVGRAASTVGWLYALNTIGAATGAIAATWVLLPQAGLDGALRIAAGLNILCAAAAVPLALSARRSPRPSADHAPVPPVAVAASGGPTLTRGVTTWAVLFAVSGFVGLSLEIVWFRLLGTMLKSTALTFGTLLSVYLLGLGLGSGIGSAIAARVRRPAFWFLALQAGAGAYAALTLTAFVGTLGDDGALSWFSTYFRQYDGVDVHRAIGFWLGREGDAGTAPGDFIRLYLTLPALLVGPPTILAGLSFPLLQRVVQTDLARLGRRVGVLLTANVVGSTIGALVSGWLLLDRFGTAGTMKLLYIVSVAFAALALRQLDLRSRTLRAVAYSALLLLAVGVVSRMPTARTLWARLHGAAPQLLMHGEDSSGLSALRANRADFRNVVVYVNGLGQSGIPYGGIHTVLGALPAFVHPLPRSAALIGLGSGDTLFSLAGRTELERITSIEIIAPQLATLRELAAWQGYPGLTTLLTDPRIQHVSGDGRLYLERTSERFDIIEADALRPRSAYAGNLYSAAYFSLLRQRLNPGGLAVTWVPTPRVLRTFLTVFPYVWHHGDVAMGSDAPIVIDAAAVARRLDATGVGDRYVAAGVHIRELLEPYMLGGGQSYDPSDDRSFSDLNTDLHPRDEFDVPPLIELPFVR